MGDSLPPGQKKIVTESLEKYIQDFPFTNSESHERPEIIASYNALYKEALRKNKALALQRKWIIEFNWNINYQKFCKRNSRIKTSRDIKPKL